MILITACLFLFKYKNSYFEQNTPSILTHCRYETQSELERYTYAFKIVHYNISLIKKRDWKSQFFSAARFFSFSNYLLKFHVILKTRHKMSKFYTIYSFSRFPKRYHFKFSICMLNVLKLY